MGYEMRVFHESYINSRKIRISWYLFLLILFTNIMLYAQKQVQAVIDVTETHPPISKYVYGQFIEHIGNIINHGIWAEMLDDRKFYYPILEEEPETAPGWRQPPRRWIAIGPIEITIKYSLVSIAQG